MSYDTTTTINIINKLRKITDDLDELTHKDRKEHMRLKLTNITNLIKQLLQEYNTTAEENTRCKNELDEINKTLEELETTIYPGAPKVSEDDTAQKLMDIYNKRGMKQWG